MGAGDGGGTGDQYPAAEDARRLYHGWADGFNAFLRSRRFHDPSCKGQPWVRPITFQDLALRGLQIELGASSGTFISDLYDAQPPGPSPRSRPRAGRACVPEP